MPRVSDKTNGNISVYDSNNGYVMIDVLFINDLLSLFY